MLTAALLLCGAQACGPNERQSQAPPVSAPKPPATSLLVTATSAQTIDGQHPTLSLSCYEGEPAAVLVNLIHTPTSPPPLRGVFAGFSAGSGFRIEMSWGMDGNWSLRTNDDPAEGGALIEAFLTNGSVTMRGDSTYMPAESITWSADPLGPDVDRIRAMCLDQ